MKSNKLTDRWRWLVLFITAGLIVGGGYFVASRLPRLTQNTATTANQATTAATSTVTIQPAELAQTAVSAAGNLTLLSERSLALGVDGVVEEIATEVGESAHAGDMLLKLNTADLQRALQQAELTVESA
ncbi:MAG TPA: biotin/lipoyl-binding protein, partial [Caldilineaceae bacterium]|nr:biotin/lipoyl-binding protein [Caldilineaceae bacterium]